MSLRWTGLVVALVAACDQSSFDVPDATEPPPGPGSPTWDDTDLSCSSSSDCAPGETCDSNKCRPRKCDDGPYASSVPLGPNHLLFREQELLVTDGSASQGAYWVDGYDAAGSISYGGAAGGSFNISAAAVVDVARIHTPDGGAMIAASAGSTKVTMASRTFAKKVIDVGLVPVAVGAGDVDADGVEDIVALSTTGQISICKQTGGCTKYNFGNNERGVDVAVADTNADNVAEIMFLLRTGDKTTIAAWSVGVANGFYASSYDTHFDAIAAGDIDKDDRAEIAVLEDRGWFGYADDRVHIYKVNGAFTGVVAVNTTGSAVDLSMGAVDATDSGESIVVLGDNKAIDVLRWSGTGIVRAFGGTVGTTGSPKRLALSDLDNDSVAARLVSGPDLVAGELTPTTVLTFPPYHSSMSGADTSGVTVGNNVEMSERYTDTVSLFAGVEVGIDVDFVGIFKGRLGTRLSGDVSRSKTASQRSNVGTRFSLRPQTQLYGNSYGAVVVACNCFHKYEYELVDSTNRMGGSGRKMTMMVPVGGQTTVLSTPRYNALAASLGTIPKIEIPRRIGDPASYPPQPQKFDGTPVPDADHVFTNRPTLRVSDIGEVGFNLSVGTGTTNDAAINASISVSANFTALGLQWGGNIGVGWGKSFGVHVGENADFAGHIPPLADRPNTQEDEFVQYGYSMQPYVYRHTYAHPVSGEPSGYYVMDYAVGAR